jgi:hypothetical protein
MCFRFQQNFVTRPLSLSSKHIHFFKVCGEGEGPGDQYLAQPGTVILPVSNGYIVALHWK